jgi:hypothetical protein
MDTNLIYEDRLDGAYNYVQWKVRSVDNRKLWRITVTIARSVLLKWGFSFGQEILDAMGSGRDLKAKQQ